MLHFGDARHSLLVLVLDGVQLPLSFNQFSSQCFCLLLLESGSILLMTVVKLLKLFGEQIDLIGEESILYE